MEEYLPDKDGHVPVPGHTATYPQGYRVYFLHGEFAGMEPPEQVEESSTPTKKKQPRTEEEQ